LENEWVVCDFCHNPRSLFVAEKKDFVTAGASDGHSLAPALVSTDAAHGLGLGAAFAQRTGCVALNPLSVDAPE
jgi:hypothetical protein